MGHFYKHTDGSQEQYEMVLPHAQETITISDWHLGQINKAQQGCRVSKQN